MNSDFDLFVKSLIDENEHIDIPDKIVNGIEETLQDLSNVSEVKNNSIKIKKKAKKRSFILKKVSAAAALIIVSLLGFTIAFPAVAEEIPILNKIIGANSIFNTSKSSIYGDEYKNLSNLSDISIGIEKSVTDKEITVTIKEIACDDTAFYIAYDVQSLIDIEDDNKQQSRLEHIAIDGKEYRGGGARIVEKIDAKTIRYTEIHPITGGDIIPKSFQLSLDFTELIGVKGDWKLSFALTKADLTNKIKIIQPNKMITLSDDKAKLVKLVDSPAYISLVSEHSNYQPNDYLYSIMNDKGDDLESVDLGGIEKKFSKDVVTRFYKKIGDSVPKKFIVLKSKKEIFAPEKLKESNYISLDSKLPKEIQISKDKYINIESIEKNDSKMLIIFSGRDFSVNTFAFHGGITLYDSSKSKSDRGAYQILRPNSLGNNKYKVEVENRNIQKSNFDSLAIASFDEMFDIVSEIDID